MSQQTEQRQGEGKAPTQLCAKEDLRTASCVTNCIHHTISTWFYRYGLWVERRPCVAIVIAILVIVLSGLGFMAIKIEGDGWIFVAEDSTIQLQIKEVTAAFASTSQLATTVWGAPEGSNILDLKYLELVLIAQNAAKAVKTSSGKNLWDVCNHKCESFSLFDTIGVNTTAQLQAAYPTLSGQWDRYMGYFGSITWGDHGNVVGASVIRSTLTMDTAGFSLATEDENKAFMEQWALSLADMLAVGVFPTATSSQAALDAEAAAGGKLQAWGYNEFAMDRLAGDMMTAEAPLMLGTMIIILIFMALILGGGCPRASRVGMAFFSLITCLTSLTVALGLGSALQVPFTTMSPLLFFALLGIGVDDIVIIVRAVDAATTARIEQLESARAQDPEAGRSVPSGKEWEGVFAEALSTAGVAITITSLTSVLAFAVASTAKIPMIKWFCYHGMLGIAAVYFIQLTLFTGALVLDEQRRRAGRWDFFCCCRSKTQMEAAGHSTSVDIIPSLSCGGKLMAVYADKLMSRPWFLALCLASWVGVLVAMCSFLPSLSGDMDVKAYLSDNSPEVAFMTIMETAYSNNTRSVDLVLRGNTLPSTAALEGLPKIVGDMAKLEIVPVSLLVEDSWVAAYLAWLNASSTQPLFHSFMALSGTALQSVLQPLQTEPAAFSASVKAFLASPPFSFTPAAGNPLDVGSPHPVSVRPASFRTDVSFDTNGHISLTRVHFTAYVHSQLSNRVAGMKTLQAQLLTTSWGTESAHAYMLSDFFGVTERDDSMVPMIIDNLVIASIGVTASVMIIMHPLAGIFVGCMITLLNATLLGFLGAVGQSLDFVAFMMLTMSVGMSVDYTVHTVHAMIHLPSGTTPMKRMDVALRTMGTCIFEGGTSTFLGVCMLAFASSSAFRTFFIIMSTCVALGLAYGLVWAPALLWLLFTAKDAIAGRSS